MTFTILSHVVNHYPEFCEEFDNIDDAQDAFECYCLNGPQSESDEGIELVSDYLCDNQDTLDYDDW